MSLFFYNIFLILYRCGISIVAVKSNKARLWISGRKNIFTHVQLWRNQQTKPVIWVHCASLGEFEQGRPIIENIKKTYPNYCILLTFFSPSGYQIRKNYTGVDGVFYLPSDGNNNATKFINIIQPNLVIWIKYEYWYYYLTILKNKNIPVLLVSAVFRHSQPFFKWYGGMWQKILHSFDKIFVQNQASIQLLQQHNLAANAILAGDTRFDRVIANAEQPNTLPAIITQFTTNHPCIVAGSTWLEDEEILVHFIKNNPAIKCIIAPHEVDAERLTELKKLFPNSAFFSNYVLEQNNIQVLIIDNVGMLANLYRLATVAYIGGGFNSSGIHNILEAAVFGKPIIFGPVYEKFTEAVGLVNEGAACSIENALQVEEQLNIFFNDSTLLKKASATSKQFVYKNAGATTKIVAYIEANRLLTS